jgi:hypothetical protein
MQRHPRQAAAALLRGHRDVSAFLAACRPSKREQAERNLARTSELATPGARFYPLLRLMHPEAVLKHPEAVPRDRKSGTCMPAGDGP